MAAWDTPYLWFHIFLFTDVVAHFSVLDVVALNTNNFGSSSLI
jgi:hypothetical protein